MTNLEKPAGTEQDTRMITHNQKSLSEDAIRLYGVGEEWNAPIRSMLAKHEDTLHGRLGKIKATENCI